MKLLLFITFTFCCNVMIGQQELSIDWSPTSTKAFLHNIVTEDANYFYGFSTFRKEYFYFERYDKTTLSLKKKTPLELADRGIVKIEYSFEYKGLITLFYSVFIKGKKKHTLYACHVNKLGVITSKKTKVLEMQYDKRAKPVKFKITQHPQDSTHCFIYQYRQDIGFPEMTWSYAIVDENLSILKTAEIITSSEDFSKKQALLDCIIDKQDNIYWLLGKSWCPEHLYDTCTLIRYSTQSGSIKKEQTYFLNGKSEELLSIPLLYLRNDQLIITAIRSKEQAFYRKVVEEEDKKKETENRSIGILWSVIKTETGALESTVRNDFKLNKEIETIPDDIRNGYGLNTRFMPVEIRVSKTGLFYLVCEMISSLHESYTFNSGIYMPSVSNAPNATIASSAYVSYYVHNYGYIMICNLSEYGTIYSLSYVSKQHGFLNQNKLLDRIIDTYEPLNPKVTPLKNGNVGMHVGVQYNGYSSYTLLEKEDELYFLFNDYPTNYTKGVDNKKTNSTVLFEKGVIAYSKVYRRGKSEKFLVKRTENSLEELNDLIRSRIAYQTKEGAYLIFTYRIGLNHLGRIKFSR